MSQSPATSRIEVLNSAVRAELPEHIKRVQRATFLSFCSISEKHAWTKGQKDKYSRAATLRKVLVDGEQKKSSGHKKAKEMDIQQLKFAGGHPPNYYAAGKLLKYARADGMACSQLPVVVCDRICFYSAYIA